MMSSIKSLLKLLFTLLILSLIYSEFFATHIKLVNKTNYDIYAVKGEYNTFRREPSSKELDLQQRLVIAPHSKQSYSVRFDSQITHSPVDISLGWDTRLYDEHGDSISIIEGQGSSFEFSEDGFCDYEIIIHEQYAEARGFNKYFCYRKILLHSSKNVIVTH